MDVLIQRKREREKNRKSEREKEKTTDPFRTPHTHPFRNTHFNPSVFPVLIVEPMNGRVAEWVGCKS
jgi:hypothetical protein